MRERFWETKTLDELDDEEWEALCDGCAQCCRLRFRDGESDQVVTTTLVCALLDLPTRRCTNYPKRTRAGTGLRGTHARSGEKIRLVAGDLRVSSRCGRSAFGRLAPAHFRYRRNGHASRG